MIWKKLPGLVWVITLIVLAERRFAPGTFSRLMGGAPEPAVSDQPAPVR